MAPSPSLLKDGCPLISSPHLTVLLREQVEVRPQPCCGTWVPAMTLQEAGAGLPAWRGLLHGTAREASGGWRCHPGPEGQCDAGRCHFVPRSLVLAPSGSVEALLAQCHWECPQPEAAVGTPPLPSRSRLLPVTPAAQTPQSRWPAFPLALHEQPAAACSDGCLSSRRAACVRCSLSSVPFSREPILCAVRMSRHR